MAAIPEWVEMRVPPVGECKNKILQVAVIRGADDQVASGPKQLLREMRQIERSHQVLDYKEVRFPEGAASVASDNWS